VSLSKKAKTRTLYVVNILFGVLGMVAFCHMLANDTATRARRLEHRHKQYMSPVVSEWEPNEVFTVAKERQGMAPTPYTLVAVVRHSDGQAVWVCTEHPERFAKGDTVSLQEVRYYRNTNWEENAFLYIKSR
jgi:hypothetical protein